MRFVIYGEFNFTIQFIDEATYLKKKKNRRLKNRKE